MAEIPEKTPGREKTQDAVKIPAPVKIAESVKTSESVKIPAPVKTPAREKKYDLPALVVSGVALVFSVVSFYQTHELEKETAALAKVQREQIEVAKEYPKVSTEISTVTIHYTDGKEDDTEVKITIENMSSLNRSVNRCSVGLLDPAVGQIPFVSREAMHRDKEAQYPITIAPNSSLILYAYGSYYEALYEERFGKNSRSPKPVVLTAAFAGMNEPLVRNIGTYSPVEGFRPSKP